MDTINECAAVTQKAIMKIVFQPKNVFDTFCNRSDKKTFAHCLKITQNVAFEV